MVLDELADASPPLALSDVALVAFVSPALSDVALVAFVSPAPPEGLPIMTVGIPIAILCPQSHSAPTCATGIPMTCTVGTKVAEINGPVWHKGCILGLPCGVIGLP